MYVVFIAQSPVPKCKKYSIYFVISLPDVNQKDLGIWVLE